MNLVEQRRKEAEEIALSLFRFRARRGTGVFYASLSSLPPFAVILSNFLSSYEVLGAFLCLIAGVWIISKLSGFQSFAKMSYTIELLRGSDSDVSKLRSFNPSGLILALWPWIAFALAEAQGLNSLAVIFLVIWIVQFTVLRVFSIDLRRKRKATVVILDRKIEDWIVTILFPVATGLLIVPGVLSLGFLLASPVLLFAGIKSLYEAPKELAQDFEQSER